MPSLRSGESDLAMALGGVGALLAPEVTIGFCKASMLSPDGRCRAFDARANGYVRSEGAGAVVLKPLDRALADGDPIRALILGSAINQDGRTTGMSVPSAAAQEAMIRAALRDAGVEPRDVGYVEAHGTGTAVGDPIEAEALGRVFAPGREPDAPCLIGSVKTNLGHLEAACRDRRPDQGRAGGGAAAGSAAPALLRAEPCDPLRRCLRLRVPTALEPWPADAAARWPASTPSGSGAPTRTWSSRHPRSMHAGGRASAEARTQRLGADERPSQRRARLSCWRSRRATRTPCATSPAATLPGSPATRRPRCATTATRPPCAAATTPSASPSSATRTTSSASASTRFAEGERPEGVVVGRARQGDEPKLAFVFPGMGPQWWGMGRRLLSEEPVFRRELEEIDGLLRPLAGWSLLDALTADEAVVAGRRGLARARRQLRPPGRHRGAVALVGGRAGRGGGTQLGRDGRRLRGGCAVAPRRRAARLPPRPAAASGDRHRPHARRRDHAREAERAIAGHEGSVSVAAVNAPSSVTLSGAADVLERIERSMTADGRFARFLPVDVPYHAPQMDPLREAFLEATADLAPTAPRVPMVLDVTGDWADGGLLDGDYWWRNIRQTVRFGPAIERLVEAGHGYFLEVGPHPVLAAAIAETGAERGQDVTVLPSLRRGEDDRRVMLGTLRALYAGGLAIDWAGVYPEGTCVPLPAYPWQRERHWFDDGEAAAAAPRPASGVDTGHPLLGRRLSSPRPTWETTLDDPRSAYLDEHVVQGSAVFPGAAYAEMLLAAAHDLSGASPVSVEDIEFRKLLFLNRPRAGVVQLHHDPRDGSAEIHSGRSDGESALPNGETSWTVHTVGRLNTGDHADGERLDLRALRGACPDAMPPSEHYEMFERRGYRFGPSFRTLQEIHLGPNEALARVSFPAEVDLAVDAYRVHPAMLDAALQLFGTVRVRSKAAPHDDAPFFPVSIRRLVHRRNPGRRFWAYVTVRHKDDPQRWNGDAWLIDESGEVCVALEQLRFKVLDEVAAAGEERPAPRQRDADALYELGWEPAALAAPAWAAPYPWRPAADVRADIEAAGSPPERIPDVADYLERAEPQLNRIATGFAAAALDALGLRAGAGNDRSREATATVAPQHRRRLHALQRMCSSPDASDQDIESSSASSTRSKPPTPSSRRRSNSCAAAVNASPRSCAATSTRARCSSRARRWTCCRACTARARPRAISTRCWRASSRRARRSRPSDRCGCSRSGRAPARPPRRSCRTCRPRPSTSSPTSPPTSSRRRASSRPIIPASASPSSTSSRTRPSRASPPGRSTWCWRPTSSMRPKTCGRASATSGGCSPPAAPCCSSSSRASPRGSTSSSACCPGGGASPAATAAPPRRCCCPASGARSWRRAGTRRRPRCSKTSTRTITCRRSSWRGRPRTSGSKRRRLDAGSSSPTRAAPPGGWPPPCGAGATTRRWCTAATSSAAARTAASTSRRRTPTRRRDSSKRPRRDHTPLTPTAPRA
jgi:acyl transferase domain-containing protein